MRRVAPSLFRGLAVRSLAVVVVCGGLALALGARGSSARAEDEAGAPAAVPAGEPSAALEVMKAQIASLKAEVDLLKSQRDALAASVDRVAKAAAALRSGAATARTQGFEAAAISPASRATVLSTFESLARDLSGAALPAPSPQEREARRKADELAKVWKR